MAARVLTSLAHGTFFGVGAVVATGLVPPERRASAISIMMTGLTVATLLGVPVGAWLGLRFGWRATFWAVAAVGVAATLIVGKWVPHGVGGERVHFADELRAIARPQVVLGLLITVLGFGGLFAAYTYIQPILIELAGFKEREISPILLVFGVGMIVGNVLGGRWADHRLNASLLGTLAALAVALGLMNLAMHSQLTAVLFIGLLGVVAFATVSPMQMRVLQQVKGAGQNLASSFNIAAFNLGNAIGAWLGGWVIAHGLGLTSVSWVGMLITLSGLLVALGSLWSEGRQRRAESALVICTEGQA